jgi:hypothetical protein
MYALDKDSLSFAETGIWPLWMVPVISQLSGINYLCIGGASGASVWMMLSGIIMEKFLTIPPMWRQDMTKLTGKFL